MGFTHFDEKGKAIMVDVTEKRDTVREATATGKITVNEECSVLSKKELQAKGMCLELRQQQGLWEQRGHRI